MENLVLHGDFVYSKSSDDLAIYEDSYLIIENGLVQGIYTKIPPEFAGFAFHDFVGKLITPGFVDLHTHAAQYSIKGIQMDLELLPWLNNYVFKEESKFADEEYGAKVYGYFTDELLKSSTTRAVIFASIHSKTTLNFMDMLEKSGLKCYVGKVNMDRNSPDYLCETTADSVKSTKEWIERCSAYKNTRPILTPRFFPSCSEELLTELSKIHGETNLPVQSHLSENLSEVAWVKELCPDAKTYSEAYHKFGLFGGRGGKVVMAHCVHLEDRDIELLKENQVFVAHCPLSNMNLTSGVSPIKKLLKAGVKVGIGTDVAAGESLSVTENCKAAIQASKLRSHFLGDKFDQLTAKEAFFLATLGGGEFFGKVGSFEKGYEGDVVVFDDENLKSGRKFSPAERLERLFYTGTYSNVFAKYVSGKKIK